MQFSKEKLSPSAIAEELQQAIMNLPEFDGWADFFEGGTGRTIVELIAGSQAIKNHFNMMRVRESSIQHAKMDSSITELAIGKGVYRPPAKGYIVEYKFRSLLSGNIQKGDLLGSYKDFHVYSLEDKVISVGNNTLKMTFGNLVEKEITVLEEENFHIEDFYYDDMFLSDHFQEMTIDNERVFLTDQEMNLYHADIANSVISLVFANQGRTIFGDGVTGKKALRNQVIRYTVLTYDKSITEEYDHRKFNLDNAEMFMIDSYEVIRRATGYLDKEVLRRTAIRNSIDGRWVQTLDFENGIMRQFGEYLNDVIVFDSYPTEYITMLPKSGMVNEFMKTEILNLINDKRGNAVDIDIKYIDPDDEANYKDFTFDFSYFGVDSNTTIEEVFNSYIEKVTFKIANGDTYIVGADIAVELSKLLPNGKVFCDLDQKYLLSDLQFMRILKLNFHREG